MGHLTEQCENLSMEQQSCVLRYVTELVVFNPPAVDDDGEWQSRLLSVNASLVQRFGREFDGVLESAIAAYLEDLKIAASTRGDSAIANTIETQPTETGRGNQD